MILFAAVVWPGGLFAQETAAEPGAYRSFSPFPILMYDSDIGFGYGGRVKFVDYFKKKESLDLILFNSTKGERWYVFTFSIPDLEIRQGPCRISRSGMENVKTYQRSPFVELNRMRSRDFSS